MNVKTIIMVLVLPLLAAQCKKETPPDLPDCDYLFECKVDGQTWKPKGGWNNPDLTIYYSPDTIGNWIGGRMTVFAQNVEEGWVGSSYLLISLDSLYIDSKPKTSLLNYILVSEVYASLPEEEARLLYDFDSIITSNLTIHEFVPDNYSKDWFGGYINMSFEATLMNGIGETVNITDGRMCQRFQ